MASTIVAVLLIFLFSAAGTSQAGSKDVYRAFTECGSSGSEAEGKVTHRARVVDAKVEYENDSTGLAAFTAALLVNTVQLCTFGIVFFQEVDHTNVIFQLKGRGSNEVVGTCGGKIPKLAAADVLTVRIDGGDLGSPLDCPFAP